MAQLDLLDVLQEELRDNTLIDVMLQEAMYSLILVIARRSLDDRNRQAFVDIFIETIKKDTDYDLIDRDVFESSIDIVRDKLKGGLNIDA